MSTLYSRLDIARKEKRRMKKQDPGVTYRIIKVTTEVVN